MRREVRNLPERLHSAAGRYAGALSARVAPPARRWRTTAEEKTESIAADAPESLPRWRRDPALARLEAVLFLSRDPLPSRKLAQLAHLADGTAARTLIRRLNDFYDQAGCAFRLEEVAGGFQLLTRPMFGPWLRRLLPTPVETRLSAPSMETLAVIAYRQPVARTEIESIRGVQCGEILRQLMERDLVRMTGRSDELGRPFLYGTTKRFLQIFGLRRLDELPRAAILCSAANRTPAASGQTPALTTIESTTSGECRADEINDPDATI